MAVENIDHTKTKARSLQTNGIYERFQWPMLNEFYQVVFHKKVYTILEELQAGANEWVRQYNEEWLHHRKYCYGKTPCERKTDRVQSYRRDEKEGDNIRSNLKYYMCCCTI